MRRYGLDCGSFVRIAFDASVSIGRRWLVAVEMLFRFSGTILKEGGSNRTLFGFYWRKQDVAVVVVSVVVFVNFVVLVFFSVFDSF